VVSLDDELSSIRAAGLGRLDPAEWEGLRDAIERLRMRQLAEHGPQVGDTLPDFALPDAAGRVVASGELLDRGPLVLAFFRGGWCPYCDRTLRALEAARPRLEEAGATLAGVAPCRPEELARVAAEKGLGYLLLSDTGGRLAALCGLLYAMTPAQIAFYRDRWGADVPAVGAGTGWELPLAASYVAGRDGVIAYAFADADWARRAEPEDLVGAVRALSAPQAAGIAAPAA
jgi:peroxiredoxin